MPIRPENLAPPRVYAACGKCGATQGLVRGRKRCRPCWRQEMAAARAANPERYRAYSRTAALRSYHQRRARVIGALGGACGTCGEREMAFLVVDHLAGGGRAERRAVGITGSPAMYRHIEQSGPDRTRYGVLCHNCNFTKSLGEGVTRRSACGECTDGSCRVCLRRAAGRDRAARTAAAERARVLDALGNRCACCSLNEPRLLATDHINGDGAEHRRLIGNSSTRVRRAVLESGPDPTRFQLLCHNCNFAKSHNPGGCPHGNC